jgi:threonine dehydratase
MRPLPTPDAIPAVAERLRPFLVHTPVEECGVLSDRVGRPVLMKWESLQHTGSFKLRGALARLLALHDAGAREVVAVSAGNHGLGVAHAARLLDMQALVVVPEGAARTKVAGIKRQGARLLVRGAGYDEAEVAARELAEQLGLPFVSPYNDADVVLGQATLTWELLHDARPGTLILPVGGGGLLAGARLAAQALGAELALVGAQPENAPAMHEALRTGAIAPVVESPTAADGLAGNLEQGSITFDLLRDAGVSIRLVTERGIAEAVRTLLEHEHLVVEPSGAVGVAALLEGYRPDRPGPVALVATGRNVDLDRLRALCDF